VDVKSFVGLIPVFAVLAISEDDLEKLPSFRCGYPEHVLFFVLQTRSDP
jgi:hypothetical protein